MKTVTGSLATAIPAERAVSTTIARTEIAAALDGPETPELVLDLSRRGEAGEEREELGITWSRDELERLLELATSDPVRLTFDRAELEQAFGDVEAHGLRERILVVAVAAAGALGTGATIANAMPVAQGGGGGPVTATPVVSTYGAPGTAAEAAAKAAHGTAVTAAQTGGGTSATASSSRGSSGVLGGIGAPSLADDLIGGGLALAIAGAAFAVGRRSGTIRPA